MTIVVLDAGQQQHCDNNEDLYQQEDNSSSLLLPSSSTDIMLLVDRHDDNALLGLVALVEEGQDESHVMISSSDAMRLASFGRSRRSSSCM